MTQSTTDWHDNVITFYRGAIRIRFNLTSRVGFGIEQLVGIISERSLIAAADALGVRTGKGAD
jgi:hypothetical protein